MSSTTAALAPDTAYRRFLAEGRFMLQRSAAGRHVFYPRVAEPGSGEALDWVPADGRGCVHSVTVVRSRPPAPNYNVALIDLVEGVRLMSRVDGVPPEAVHIGMAVVAKIVVENDAPLLVFVPQAAP
jgi:uncharacterized protein